MIVYIALVTVIAALICIVYLNLDLRHLDRINKEKGSITHEEKVQYCLPLILTVLAVVGVCNHGTSMGEIDEIQKYSPQQVGL